MENKKLIPRLARGFLDLDARDFQELAALQEKIAGVYAQYGFEKLETPFLEYADVLGAFLPDVDRPHAGLFSFQDQDKQWLSLRYDLTAPLSRHYAANYQTLPKPYRAHRSGWVFRNEKPGPGRYRQFIQSDVDTVGSASIAADAEMCMIAADVMDTLGLERSAYVIRLNNRKILEGLLRRINLEDQPERRLTVLRAIDKLDRLGMDALRELLTEGRKDESGDFTKGAHLPPESLNLLSSFLEAKAADSSALLTHVESIIGDEEIAGAGVAELRDCVSLLEAAGYGDVVTVDPCVVRGLGYYTGPVFEIGAHFKGVGAERFGAVGGGGRYDGLVARFLPEPVPATGFSIGVSRLYALLQEADALPARMRMGPVVVLSLDQTLEAARDAQRIVASLRAAGVRAESYMGTAGMKAQMKYASRRQSPCVVIRGETERKADRAIVKDLVLGSKADQNADREEYLRQQRESQTDVLATEIVSSVKRILERISGS